MIKLYRVIWENSAGSQCEMAVHAESPEDAAWRAALKLQGRTEMQVFISASEITAAERGEHAAAEDEALRSLSDA